MLDQYPDVLTVDDLSKILRINKSTTYRILQDGVIPCRRIGTTYRISKKHVLNFLNQIK